MENPPQKPLSASVDALDGIRVEWRSSGLVSLKDCIELGSAKWFGGSEEYFQHFPLDLEQVGEISELI